MSTSSSQKTTPIIVWFRQDLRLEDQPTLSAAIALKAPIIPLFIWSPQDAGKWPMGAASQWWLHHSLISLQKDLHKLGLNLIICKGEYLKTLLKLAKETHAQAVFWNRCYEPALLEKDATIKSELQKKGIDTQISNGSLLFEPWAILNKSNQPFKVFTFFWKRCLKDFEPFSTLKCPAIATPYTKKIASLPIDSLKLLPKIHWDKGLIETWQPGEKQAKQALQDAVKTILPNYLQTRDFPAIVGTSGLSPYLHFGELSPRTIWQTVKENPSLDEVEAEAFLRQICWREFGYYLLYHFPHTPEKPLNPKFANLPWQRDSEGLKAWQKGLTGYPLVDAGMRQLWKTGWMHNRVRMLVGSFLVKDLLIPWQEGEKWFWDTLVDADLANNTLGWQWIGGCGADAAPYFRIFNPITQSKKFDHEGEYIKKWIPELAALSTKWIHCPWEAPEEVLRKAGITLGVNYPKPIVNHDEARLRALKGFYDLRKEEE